MAATLAVYGVTAGKEFYEDAHLRQQYPLESVASRLAYESQPSPHVHQSNTPPADHQVEFLEDTIDHWKPHWRSSHLEMRGDMARVEGLRVIHASYVEQFISSQGFGVGRMRVSSPQGSLRHEKPDPPVPLPDRLYEDPLEIEEELRLPRPADPGPGIGYPLQSFHRDSFLNFVFVAGFGYVADRDHVAGFRPHQFRSPPKPIAPVGSCVTWRVRGLDLISLLKHVEPVA